MARNFTPRYQRKEKLWAATNLGGSVAITGNSTNLLGSFLNFATSDTVMRIRGHYFIALGATVAALDEALISIGIGVVSTDAAVVGSSAMPDPGEEPNFPWIWYDLHRVFSPFAVDGTGSDDSGVTIHRGTVDSKAMRKLKSGQSMVVVVQYQDANGTPPVKVGFDARVLIGLN